MRLYSVENGVPSQGLPVKAGPNGPGFYIKDDEVSIPIKGTLLKNFREGRLGCADLGDLTDENQSFFLRKAGPKELRVVENNWKGKALVYFPVNVATIQFMSASTFPTKVKGRHGERMMDNYIALDTTVEGSHHSSGGGAWLLR